MNYIRLFIPNSYVFITICTQKRQKILIENIKCLRQSFKYALCKFNFEITAAVINPEHFHLILKTENIKDYPKITGIIKKHFTQTSGIEYSIKNNREADIWQRRYYEHTIRNEEDLYRHIDYIHYNPVKHNLVSAPKDWEYSSFKKFVKQGLYEENWCNFNDKHGINTMNIE